MDARKPRDGKAIEEVGYYDPMVRDKSKRVVVNLDRVDHWISVGAQPSEKVAVLLRKVREGDWGEAKAPPPMTPPTEKKVPEPESAEAAPEEGAAEESPAEEAAVAE
jgi:small subunit ribosomal protein S16